MRAKALLLALFLPIHSLAAQWQLSALHGSATVTGFSRDDRSAEPFAFLPDKPSRYAITLAREVGRNRLSLELHRTGADLALRGQGTVVITTRALHAWGVALDFAHRLAGDAGHPMLHGGIGVLMERWSFDIEESDPRSRIALRASLDASVPISRHWHGIVRTAVVAGPSLFKAAELPEGYLRKLGVRRGVELGVGWGW